MEQPLEGILREVEGQRIREYLLKTELPALKRVLGYVAEKKEESRDGWVNQYCDYRDCSLFF
jgi:hypothetical protein